MPPQRSRCPAADTDTAKEGDTAKKEGIQPGQRARVSLMSRAKCREEEEEEEDEEEEDEDEDEEEDASVGRAQQGEGDCAESHRVTAVERSE